MEDDKVLEALQVIKEYCRGQNLDCENCRLWDGNDSCTLSIDVPSDWKIKQNKEYKFIL